MSAQRWTRGWARGIVLAAMLIPAGCASLRSSIPTLKDISKERQARSTAIARQIDRKRDRAELQDAQARSAQGDVRGAIDVLQRLLARNPNHLEARLLMAESLLDDNRAAEARACLEPAVASHPDDPRVVHLMGLILDASGQKEEALAYYQQAAQLDPKNEVYAVSYQMAASPPESVERAGPAAFGSPATAPAGFAEEAGFDRAAGYAEAGGVYGGASETVAAELLAKGSAALAGGEPALASACFREAIAAQPEDPHIPVAAAISALRHNQPDIAVSLLEPLVDVFPQSVALHRTLAVAYYRRGDYASSQVALRQALWLDKSSGLSYFLMGSTLAKLGQTAEAEMHFRQARQLDPRLAPPR